MVQLLPLIDRFRPVVEVPMPEAVADRAKPHHVKRLRIIVMMCDELLLLVKRRPRASNTEAGIRVRRAALVAARHQYCVRPLLKMVVLPLKVLLAVRKRDAIHVMPPSPRTYGQAVRAAIRGVQRSAAKQLRSPRRSGSVGRWPHETPHSRCPRRPLFAWPCC